jgi:hypothetical protein
MALGIATANNKAKQKVNTNDLYLFTLLLLFQFRAALSTFGFRCGTKVLNSGSHPPKVPRFSVFPSLEEMP